MADESKFPIKISAAMEGDGLKKTADGLDDLGKKTEEAGKQAVEHGEKTELSHRKVKEVIRETTGALGAQIPAVGLLTEASTAGFGAIVITLELVKTAFENLEAPLNRAKELFSKLDASALKDAAEAVTNMATAMGSIVDKQSDLEAAFRRSNAAADAQLQKLNAILEAQTRIDAANEKAFESELDRQTALHPEQKEQNDARKESARLALEGRADQRKEQELQNKITTEQTAFDNARIRITGGGDARGVAAAQTAVDEAKAASDQAKIKLEGAQSVPVQESIFGRQTYDQARAALHHAEVTAEADKKQTGQADPNAQKYIDALKGQIAQYEASLAPLKAAADAAAVAENHAKTALANAQAQADADAKLNIEGALRIKSLQDELAILQQTNRAVESANQRGANARIGTEHDTAQNAAFSHAQALERQLAEHGGTEQQWREMAALMRTVAGQLGQSDRIRSAEIRQLQQEVRQLARINGQSQYVR